jgi:hypothetical protein
MKKRKMTEKERAEYKLFRESRKTTRIQNEKLCDNDKEIVKISRKNK